MRKDRYDWIINVINVGNILDVDVDRGVVLGRKPFITPDGYERLAVHYKGDRKTYYVHEIVAVIGGMNPTDLTINHIDGNKRNNSIKNLECISMEGNRLHAQLNRLLPSGSRNGNSKLTESDVRDIKKRYGLGEKASSLAREYHVDRTNIWKIISNQTWKHI